ncbi:MAG: YbaK/prolyl-tRNA synthetase associated domain-containing protein [Streptosporangiales bacterium]|nr:YbaK/prolyl-tRNA synthetase associated domain-containing protein [Streptosporangiales bacterium]
MTHADTADPATAYDALVTLLETHDADYALIDHEPAGATDVVSALRGHPLAQAAKCLLIMVKVDRRTRRYVLAVVPGDRSVDLAAVKALYDGRYAGFCDPATAERLARTAPGTVLPFSMDPQVDLVTDPDVLKQPRLYFNAARLDRSVRLATADYQRIARPQVAPIAAAG